MSEPFLAEIRIVGFNFAPRGWAFCDGQILPVKQNQPLFSLLGATYGGDGITSFALPEMRGRTPIHKGSTYGLGQKGGLEMVTLTVAEIAAHTHTARASSENGDNVSIKSGNTDILAGSDIYREPEAATSTALHSSTITNTGGGQAHNNMQPYTTLNYCIALQGLFPSHN